MHFYSTMYCIVLKFLLILQRNSKKNVLQTNKNNRIMEKKLTKSNNKMIAGVCAGIAEYFNVDPTLVRVGYAILSFFCAGFPGLILYIILALIIPNA